MEDNPTYLQTAIEYAEEARKDRRGVKYGKWIRLAARRFLKDLKRAGKRKCPFVFDEWYVDDVCGFAEKMPHVEGKWEKPTIVLAPFQVFFLANLFGFRDARDHTRRRFTHVLFAIARKNAKSTLGSIILLYVFTCEGEEGAQIISAATTGDQARIVWRVAKRMIEKTPDLEDAFLLKPYANSIANFSTGGSFKPINAKASTQDGLNPSAVCLDELHAHKSHDLINVLKSAAGARENPLWLYTTTEGYESPGPWPEERHFAKQVLEGVVEAEHYLAIYYAVDDKDAEFYEPAWIKANPLLDQSEKLWDAIRKEAIEAKSKPGGMAEFKIKRLNRPASNAESFINLTKWKRKQVAFRLEDLKGLPCWVGTDLASVEDTSARVAAFYDPDEGKTFVDCKFWVPEEQVKQREERNTAKYTPWVESGHIVQVPGETMDFRVIRADLSDFCSEFDPFALGFDPWSSHGIMVELEEEGWHCVKFPQIPKYFQPALNELSTLYLPGRLQHGGNPVLQWHASNMLLRRDVNDNGAPDKKRSADKIDGMVALLIALGLAVAGEGEDRDSVYEERGIISI